MSNPLIKYFQDNPKVSTEDVARATGIPYNTVANLRTGRKTEPSVTEAIKLAEATGGVVSVKSWEK